jgi:hypothetical protein
MHRQIKLAETTFLTNRSLEKDIPTLTFLFQPSANDEARQAAVEEIKRWPEVSAANFLKREANNPEVRRIAFAEVPDERNQMEVLKRVQSLPVVATANLPAQRTLVEPAWKVVE